MEKRRAGTKPVQPDWELILPGKLFISYTQESSSHNKRVLSLANELRNLGFDCDLDQYHVNENWPVWMERSIEQAKHVLVVCTPVYRRRWDNEERPGVGLGAQWESLLTRQHLYMSPNKNDKFIPVVFKREHASTIPTALAGWTRIDLWLSYSTSAEVSLPLWLTCSDNAGQGRAFILLFLRGVPLETSPLPVLVCLLHHLGWPAGQEVHEADRPQEGDGHLHGVVTRGRSRTPGRSDRSAGAQSRR